MPLSQIYFIIIAVSSYLLVRKMNEPLHLQYLNKYFFSVRGAVALNFLYFTIWASCVFVCVCVVQGKKRGKEIEPVVLSILALIYIAIFYLYIMHV